MLGRGNTADSLFKIKKKEKQGKGSGECGQGGSGERFQSTVAFSSDGVTVWLLIHHYYFPCEDV